MELYEKNIDEVAKYSAANFKDDIAGKYDQLAEKYDEILEDVVGYADAKVIATECAKRVPKDAIFVDMGCGTGLIGKHLVEEGFELKDFTGIDPSQGMIQKAKEERKDIYKHFHSMFLGNGELPKEFHGKFDCAVSAGVFTPHHAPPCSIDEILDSLKIGGHIVMSLREDYYEDLGHREYFEKTIAKGRMKEVADFSYVKYEGMQESKVVGIWNQTVAHVKTYQKLA